MNKRLSSEAMEPNLKSLLPPGTANASQQAIARKVQEDILFLNDRIERIKRLQTPNSSVLKTYQAMVESRQAVLQWLRESGDVDDAAPSHIAHTG